MPLGDGFRCVDGALKRLPAVGTGRVNHPVELVLVTAMMLGFTYVMLRISLAASMQAMRAVLHDLGAEALDATAGVAATRRRARAWMAVGVALLAFGVIAGLWLWRRGT